VLATVLVNKDDHNLGFVARRSLIFL